MATQNGDGLRLGGGVMLKTNDCCKILTITISHTVVATHPLSRKKIRQVMNNILLVFKYQQHHCLYA